MSIKLNQCQIIGDKNMPCVSIGLPVYNGTNFLQEAIDSILGQTFEDFELIISDNASTDGTDEICRAYAASDSRVKYYLNSQNMGVAWNFNRVFALSTGKYFRWATHDDLLAPDLLAKCVEVLDNCPDVILCHPKAGIIDKHGEFLKNYDVKLNTDSPKPHVRFHDLLSKHTCFQIFGLVRACILKKTPLMGNYAYADGVLLLRLGLLGRFYEIPEYMFFFRVHPQQSVSLFTPDFMIFTDENPQYSISMLPDFYQYIVWWDETKSEKIVFPHWRILREIRKSITQSPISWYERIRCFRSMAQRLRGESYLLIKDLIVAANKGLFTRLLRTFSH